MEEGYATNFQFPETLEELLEEIDILHRDYQNKKCDQYFLANKLELLMKHGKTLNSNWKYEEKVESKDFCDWSEVKN
jgi:hypothetical protein